MPERLGKDKAEVVLRKRFSHILLQPGSIGKGTHQSKDVDRRQDGQEEK